MKPEWLVTNVAAVESPDRAERAILGVILGVFWPIRANCVIGEPHGDVRIPSWILTSLGSFSGNRVIDYQCNICRVPSQSETSVLGVILGVRWSIQADFVIREPLCDIGTPSWALISLLGVI